MKFKSRNKQKSTHTNYINATVLRKRLPQNFENGKIEISCNQSNIYGGKNILGNLNEIKLSEKNTRFINLLFPLREIGFCLMKNTPFVKVCLSPLQFPLYNTENFTVIIVDIFRATSAISTALSHGAKRVIPVSKLDDLSKYEDGKTIIGAERNGEIVSGYKRGNSPFDYMKNVSGKTIVLTTTNGTQAISIVKKGQRVLIGSFLTISRLVEELTQKKQSVMLLCSGWKNRINLDDSFFAGAVVSRLLDAGFQYPLDSDAAIISHDIYLRYKNDLKTFTAITSHAKRLKKLALEKDVEFCLSHDKYDTLAEYMNGEIVTV